MNMKIEEIVEELFNIIDMVAASGFFNLEELKKIDELSTEFNIWQQNNEV